VPRLRRNRRSPGVVHRGREWLSIRYPHCGGVHLGRLRPGAVPSGARRTPCDMVWVKVRRTYRPGTASGPGAAG
jgi:hypothetical protein